MHTFAIGKRGSRFKSFTRIKCYDTNTNMCNSVTTSYFTQSTNIYNNIKFTHAKAFR